MKKIASFIIAAFMLTACSAEQPTVFGPDIKDLIIEAEANPGKGFYWPYIMYTPDSVNMESTSVIFLSNNTPTVFDDYSKHYENAKHKILQYMSYSDSTGLPLLIYAIPRFEHSVPDTDLSYDDVWLCDPQGLTRNSMITDIVSIKRMDLQALKALEDAGIRLKQRNINWNGKIIPFGFSGSGTFASRLALLHPEIVEKVVAGAPGGWLTLPLESYNGKTLNYPVGIADLPEIAGIQFNLEAYKRIPKFFSWGQRIKMTPSPTWTLTPTKTV